MSTILARVRQISHCAEYTYSNRNKRHGQRSHEASFDDAAPLPKPSRPGSARPGAPSRPVSRHMFAAADGTPVSMHSSTVSASPAGRASHVSKSSLWKRADDRAAKKVAAREPSPSMATISAQNQSEQTGFDDKLAGEIAAEGLDMDRDWYLREEEGGIDETGGGFLMEDESTYKRGQRKDGADASSTVERMRDRSGKLMNLRDSKRVAEIERNMSRWDERQLLRSGVVERVVEDEDEDDRERVMLVVNSAKPPFLDGRQIFTKQMDPVLPLKDPTSDMAVVARRGSKLVMQLREKKDEAATRERFWDVTQSKIGALTGTTDREQAAAAAHAAEADKMTQKFAGDVVKDDDAADAEMTDTHIGTHMKKGQGVSEFAKTRTLAEQRRALPVRAVRQAFLDLLREHQIIVVVGETGSGKTTQLTQYLREAGYGRNGMIGCTQPRRVAAMSVAHRVAEEVGCEVGGEVGYAIRFEDCTSDKTEIKYMTDGVLLRETLRAGELDTYSAVIMDEAHERSLNTDVLFGILRSKVLSVRRDFRLVVTSATLDSDKFARFFGGVPVFEIPGRTFPVEVDYARTPQEDYVSAAVERALRIHVSEPVDGDILIFMTGREEIEATAFQLQDRLEQIETSNKDLAPMLVLPLYSELPGERQALIFDPAPPGSRKCVIATNIAETSLTIDGIRYVVDCGYCKFKVFSPKMGMDALQVFPVSQAGAKQRQGRAGRTGPGKAYPMYTKGQFEHEMLVANVPEIQRTNLANVVLLLKSLKVDNLLQFPFMDPPPQENIVSSMFQLWTLGAFDNLGALTALGAKMVEFPLDPPLAKMLITGARLDCGDEVLTIVSMLSAPAIFYRPSARQEAADSAHEKFFVPESDHLTLLNVYLQWKSHGYRDKWAMQNYLHPKALRKAKEVREQLKEIMEQQKLPLESAASEWDVVRKAICSAYFHNAAKMKGIGEYSNARSGMPCHMHPSSALYGMGVSPDYIVYHELVYTHKEYMNNVTAVEPEWLAELGPMFFSIKKRNQPGQDKRSMQRQVALEMEAQALAKAKAAKESAQGVGVKAKALDADDGVAGVMSAREKRKRDKERMAGAGVRRRVGI